MEYAETEDIIRNLEERMREVIRQEIDATVRRGEVREDVFNHGPQHMPDVQGPLKRLFTQMIRCRTTSTPGETIFDIYLPGNITSFTTQNGMAVGIDSGEITQIGSTEWYVLNNVSGTTANPTKGIFAYARKDVGGTSLGDWVVNPDSTVKIKFYTNGGIPPGTNPIPTGPDASKALQYGLGWQVCQMSSTRVVHQMALGEKIGTAVVGDFDILKSPSTNPASIHTKSVGVLQLNKWEDSAAANDPAAKMYVSVSGVGQLMDQPSTSGNGSEGDADVSSPSQYSIQTLGTSTTPRVLELYKFDNPGGGVTTVSSDLVLIRQSGGVLNYALLADL